MQMTPRNRSRHPERTSERASEEERRVAEAFATYRLLDELGPEDWPNDDDLRKIARRLGLPYLMLLLDWYQQITPRKVKLADLDEFNQTPAARRVLEQAWGAEACPAGKAVA